MDSSGIRKKHTYLWFCTPLYRVYEQKLSILHWNPPGSCRSSYFTVGGQKICTTNQLSRYQYTKLHNSPYWSESYPKTKQKSLIHSVMSISQSHCHQSIYRSYKSQKLVNTYQVVSSSFMKGTIFLEHCKTRAILFHVVRDDKSEQHLSAGK